MNRAEHRWCNKCRKQLDLWCDHSEVHAKSAEQGWEASGFDHDALCPACKETCRIGSYPSGEYNSSFLVEATEHGIEIMDAVITLDWEWIDKVRAQLRTEPASTEGSTGAPTGTQIDRAAITQP